MLEILLEILIETSFITSALPITNVIADDLSIGSVINPTPKYNNVIVKKDTSSQKKKRIDYAPDEHVTDSNI
ncbi:hypothetical protein Glove_146g48 [Diversispora epigaea]|uniref:Uncharacterized protein n=1 Tax=Diversispora epigaea TaxID=1348612 RepID=A0A397IWI1_9GLOM|nr:hypothetical protein Glove_146g48 [Diversispora epigaea]